MKLNFKLWMFVGVMSAISVGLIIKYSLVMYFLSAVFLGLLGYLFKRLHYYLHLPPS